MNESFGRARLPDLSVHDVEALAQKLYEASDPEGTRWAERGLVVRDPWLTVARKRLLAAAIPRT
jgi:hypothetical protein